MYRSLAVTLLVVATALCCSSAPLCAADEVTPGEIPRDVMNRAGVLLRLDAVEIKKVVDLYSRITGRIVLPAPELKGKVTIVNRSRVDEARAARLIEGALELQGWTFITEDNISKLVKSKDAVKRLVPTLEPRSERHLRSVNRIQTHMISLHYVKGEDVKNLISPLLSNDGTIQFNERSNLLVVTEMGTNMSRLLELIERVDRPLTSKEHVVDSRHLRHVAPKKMVETIQEYFKDGSLKFLPDERLQMLVITGKPGEVDQAITLIEHLDQPVPREQILNQILRIQYAKAEEVAALIEKLYKNRADAPPPTFSVNADKDSNSVILTGPPELRSEIAGLISRIDIRYQQVLLKVLIGELNNQPNDRFGVQWGHLVGSASELAQDFGGIGLSEERSSVRTSTPGIRYSLIRPAAYSTFISFLQIKRDFNVLASPHITVSSNKAAKFNVGSRVPVQTSERISTGNDVVRNNEFVDVGLTLDVTPRITPGADVAMDVNLKFSQQQGNNPGFINPVFSNREFNTSVIVQDEHTLVIAGLMQRTLDATVNQVPIFGELPLIGGLFRDKSANHQKQELLVMLTPTVMSDPNQSDAVTDAYKKRSFNDEQWVDYGQEWRETLEYMEDLSRVKPRPVVEVPVQTSPRIESRIEQLRRRRVSRPERAAASKMTAAPDTEATARPAAIPWLAPASTARSARKIQPRPERRHRIARPATAAPPETLVSTPSPVVVTPPPEADELASIELPPQEDQQPAGRHADEDRSSPPEVTAPERRPKAKTPGKEKLSREQRVARLFRELKNRRKSPSNQSDGDGSSSTSTFESLLQRVRSSRREAAASGVSSQSDVKVRAEKVPDSATVSPL